MNYTGLQDFIAERISKDSALGLLGTPIKVDPFAEPEAAKAAISQALRDKGVAFEIGFPGIGAPETTAGGSTSAEGMIEVFIAEHTKKAHTPDRAALVLAVIQAVTKPLTIVGQKAARLRWCESVRTEDGYILHMLSFFVPFTIRHS